MNRRAVFDARNDPRRARRVCYRTATMFRRWARKGTPYVAADVRETARELVRIARTDFRTRRGFRKAAKP